MINRLKVLFYLLFHWPGCVMHYSNSWFSKPKYSLFIFNLIPLIIIPYSASSPDRAGCIHRLVEMNSVYEIWEMLGIVFKIIFCGFREIIVQHSIPLFLTVQCFLLFYMNLSKIQQRLVAMFLIRKRKLRTIPSPPSKCRSCTYQL